MSRLHVFLTSEGVLLQGWLSISKARYALGSSALSRSIFASVGEASQMVGADERGVLVASGAERPLQGVAASRHVVSIQRDFEKAIGMAVAVANTRRKLQHSVDSGASQAEE